MDKQIRTGPPEDYSDKIADTEQKKKEREEKIKRDSEFIAKEIRYLNEKNFKNNENKKLNNNNNEKNINNNISNNDINKNSDKNQIIKETAESFETMSVNPLNKINESKLNDKKNSLNNNIINNMNQDNNVNKNNNLINKKYNYEKNNTKLKENKKEKVIKPPSTDDVIKNSLIYSKEYINNRLVEIEYKRGNEEIRNSIFNVIKREILILSLNPFGNYVIQTILYFMEKEKVNYIFDSLKDFFFQLSMDQYGCRVLQTLIEIIAEFNDKDKLKFLIDKLKELKEKNPTNFAKLFYDKNGNHVIQKLIEKLDDKEINDIYDEVLREIKLIYDKYGSHIVQSLLYKLNELKNEEKKNKIIEQIFTQDFDELCKNKYSNYVLQSIIGKYGVKIEDISEKLKGKISEFSLDNCASHIVEKILVYGNKKQRDEIGKEIIEEDKKNNNCITTLVTHMNGNYVIQKAIEYCSDDIKREIIQRINSKNIKGKYSKYVYNIMDKDIIPISISNN